MKKIFILSLISIITFAQNPHPKYEVRGVWISTVVNIDWPKSRDVEQQKEELITILNYLKDTGINLVNFQVRPECDAMYDSKIEPWSFWLTSWQGKPPLPYYDPLEFAIVEAHKRGMEIHAWFNPYRAERSVGTFNIAFSHVTNLHPDWTLRFKNLVILNPGIPDVREYNTQVISDVVRRYDVDGVHLDDYFYPYEGMNDEDITTFQKYSRGFTDISEWRRDNVNLLMKEIYDSVHTIKPYVKFGISPFGIWRNGIPEGITGMDAYNVIYADPLAWLKEKSVDYLTPQLYWQIGGPQDYERLMNWWADSVAFYGRHFYPGQALYRQSTDRFPPDEIPNQIKLNRKNFNCQGSIYFTANNFPSNPKGATDSLKNNYYKYKSLIPPMPWLDSTLPNAVKNLRYARWNSTGLTGLTWDFPDAAPDGDIANRFVVYYFDKPNVENTDFEKAENILEITNENFLDLEKYQITNKNYFAVTTLDRNWNESTPTNIFQFNEVYYALQEPILSSPSNEEKIYDKMVFKWNYQTNVEFYNLQISLDENFNQIITDEIFIDTFALISNLEGQSIYYWRVTANNVKDEINYSTTNSFFTNYPKSVEIEHPKSEDIVEVQESLFKWKYNYETNGYQIQIAKGNVFNKHTIIIDKNVTSTSFSPSNLNYEKEYVWRVRAYNDFGFSKWSEPQRIKTEHFGELVQLENKSKKFYMIQKNLNPKDSITHIEFSIPFRKYVTLKIFNKFGTEICKIFEKTLQSGIYQLKFNKDKIKTTIDILVLRLTLGKKVIQKYLIK
ncbi:MAG: family 10 glycosylhydrolase [Ignavibacteriales bacterium]|nr:family 10 glycosylhydrolase [Ignavibacteriales bacterium]